jgi:hypothetical protein
MDVARAVLTGIKIDFPGNRAPKQTLLSVTKNLLFSSYFAKNERSRP